MKLKSLLALLAVCLILPVLAQADVTFDWSYTNSTPPPGTILAAGEFTATADVIPGLWDITSLTGTRNGQIITWIPFPSSSDFLVDNKVWVPPNPQYFVPTENNGFVFSTPDGSQYNPYLISAGGDYYESALVSGDKGVDYNPGRIIGFSATLHVPDGGVPDGGMTLMLLGGVLVGLETLRRKLRV
jgi:hypothetical protein